MKCIDVKSNAFRVPLLIWLLAVLILVVVHPVKAETGSIVISGSLYKPYDTQGSACPGAGAGLTAFTYDSSDYNNIQTFTMQSNSFSFAKSANTTHFTITSGGTGTGTFAYSGTTLYWWFDQPNTANGNPLTLSYTPDITGEINLGLTCAVNPVNSSDPMFIKSGANAVSGKSAVWNYTFTSSRVVTNYYNVTYPNPGFVNFNVSKTGETVLTQTFINSSSGIVYNEGTFSTSSYTYYNSYPNGLYLGMKLQTGETNTILINSTNAVVIPTPTPPTGGQFNPPLPVPSSGGSIQFNQTKYVVGDTVRVEWAISDTDWNSITAFELDVTHEDGTEFVPGGVGVYGQTGSSSFVSTKPEIITATLKEGLIFRDTIATARTSIVPEQPSTLIIPSVVAVGKPINFTYMYGFTPQSQAAGNGIFAIKDGFAKAYTRAETSVIALTTYNANITFPESGNYVVQLKDITRGVVAYTSVNATFSFVPPTQNISVSALSIDKSTYLLNDVILADYAIDNVNYSQYQVYYQVFNYGLGIIEDYGVVGSQTGQLYVDIAPNYASGLSKFALRAKNNTADFEIIYQNFTVSKLNNRGFGMQIIPLRICAGTKVTINLTIPEAARLEISETEIGGLFSFKSISLINNTVVSFVPKYTTSYTFDLIAASDSSSQIAYTVSPNCEVGATISPTGTPPTGTQGQAQSGAAGFSSFLNNLIGFMTLPAFWGVILFLIAIIVTATNEKASGATGMVALIFSNIEAIVGLWSPFTLYIFVVTWVIAGIYFTIGRNATTQNR